MRKRIHILLIGIITVCFGLIGCSSASNKPLTEAEIEANVKKTFEKIDANSLSIARNEETNNPIDRLNILTVNDFHGALEEENNKKGIARTGEYLISRYNQAPDNTIIISAGDMFQGSAISNYRHGRDLVTTMNAIGFDVMTIGNHEFDWSLEEILKYRDGNTANGEANFPFLACNIADKQNDNQLPQYIEPYTILNKGDIKVGIIGFIGYGLEKDIATNMVKEYEFLNPVPIVEKYAIELRTEQNCDVIIAVGHDDNEITNNEIANLSGDAEVNAIVNGHTHLEKKGVIVTSDSRQVPYVEAGTAGAFVGEIVLSINDKKATYENVKNNIMDSNVSKNTELDDYVSLIVDATSPIFERVLVTAGTDINRYACTDWAVDSLRKYFDVDIAFINYGGIRSVAFPIKNSDKVKVSKVYQIMPFDNTIKLVKLTGQQIKYLMNNSDIANSTTIDAFDSSKLYSVAAVDYIFDKPEYPFLSGEDINATGILFRDVLIETLEKLGSSNKKWTC